MRKLHAYYRIPGMIFPPIAMTFLIILTGHLSAQTVDNTTVAGIIEQTRETNPELAAEMVNIYEATKRFQDVETALAEGYIRDPFDLCDTSPMMGGPAFMGAMGVHYFRPDLLGITGAEPRVNGNGLHTDFLQPAILIYEPMEDGSLALVAVENLVFQEGWHAAGNETRPDFMGYEYFGMVDNPVTKADEAHKFEAHYDLHMWLYKANPHGLFTPFNPAVSCKYHEGN